MKLGVIGFGNMGGAIVRGALKRGTLRKEIPGRIISAAFICR